MKSKKIKLDSFDIRLLIRALSVLRNQIILQDGPTDDINSLLLRLCDLADQ